MHATVDTMNSLYVHIDDITDFAAELNELREQQRKQQQEIDSLLCIVFLLLIQSLLFLYTLC